MKSPWVVEVVTKDETTATECVFHQILEAQLPSKIDAARRNAMHKPSHCVTDVVRTVTTHLQVHDDD